MGFPVGLLQQPLLLKAKRRVGTVTTAESPWQGPVSRAASPARWRSRPPSQNTPPRPCRRTAPSPPRLRNERSLVTARATPALVSSALPVVLLIKNHQRLHQRFGEVSDLYRPHRELLGSLFHAPTPSKNSPEAEKQLPKLPWHSRCSSHDCCTNIITRKAFSAIWWPMGAGGSYRHPQDWGLLPLPLNSSTRLSRKRSPG